MQTAPVVPARAGATELRTVGTGDAETCAALAALYADAYPVLDLQDAASFERFAARVSERAGLPGSTLVAAYRGGSLVGAMRWHDYRMNWRGDDVAAAGLGAVAVALDARRRGIARDLVRAFVETYREAGALVALLHPFRYDFYRDMGFGHGTKTSRYRFAAQHLPAGGNADWVRRLGPADLAAVAGCYERVRARTNGLLGEGPLAMRTSLESPATRAFGYFEHPGGKLRGYLLTFPSRTKRGNELRVEEPIYEGPEALAALLAFLRGLSDQFRTIVVQTQDPTFHVVVRDPRNGSGRIIQSPAYYETNAQGAGIMYRVLDFAAALERLRGRVAHGCPARLGIRVRDSFLPANGGDHTLTFTGGELADVVGPAVLDPLTPDAILEGDVADLSSLLAGSVRLRALYDYGLATLSNPSFVGALDEFFACDPPRCTTAF